MLGKVHTISVGDEYSDENEEEEIIDVVESASCGGADEPLNRQAEGRKRRAAYASVEEQKRLRKPGCAGLKSGADGGEMVKYMGRMEDSVSTIVEAMCEQSKEAHGNQEPASAIREAMKKETKVELPHTNNSIEEFKALIVSSLSRRQA